MGSQEKSKIDRPSRFGYASVGLVALTATLALAACGPQCRAQETERDSAPGLASNPHADAHIAEAIRQVSADHIRADD